MTTTTDTLPTRSTSTGDDERLAHLVLKDSWPNVLCGATVTDHLGVGRPGDGSLPRLHQDRLRAPAGPAGMDRVIPWAPDRTPE